jgi:hypothetical protein
LKELLWEFEASGQRKQDKFEMATAQAYQTVRIGLMVKRTKTSVRMPKWSDVLGKGGQTFTAGDSRDKGLAFLHMLAARAGTKVRMGKRKRKD